MSCEILSYYFGNLIPITNCCQSAIWPSQLDTSYLHDTYPQSFYFYFFYQLKLHLPEMTTYFNPNSICTYIPEVQIFTSSKSNRRLNEKRFHKLSR